MAFAQLQKLVKKNEMGKNGPLAATGNFNFVSIPATKAARVKILNSLHLFLKASERQMQQNCKSI